jgi:hypothetical protein
LEEQVIRSAVRVPSVPLEVVMAAIFKIAGWTFGMAIAASIIFDAKAQSTNWREHLLWGAGIGMFLGYLFSRNLKKATS